MVIRSVKFCSNPIYRKSQMAHLCQRFLLRQATRSTSVLFLDGNSVQLVTSRVALYVPGPGALIADLKSIKFLCLLTAMFLT